MDGVLDRRDLARQEADLLADAAAGLNDAGEHQRAEQACLAALAKVPEHWAALANLAVAQHRQMRHAEAVVTYVRACRANPGNAAAFSNLGVALNEMQAMDLSLQAHDAALQLAADGHQIRANRAMALLMAGHLAEGFAEFEARWEAEMPATVSGPRWRGEALDGQRLLIWDEGGFGDTLQFIRYVRMLRDAGIVPMLRVQAPLVRLVRQNFPEIAVVLSHADAAPEFDLQCPLISLAHVLGTTLDSVPGQTPYLQAEALPAAHWHEWLDGLAPGPRIGLVWAGESRPWMRHVHAMDARRSLALAQLAPLFEVPDAQWISLQLGGSEEIACACLPIHDRMSQMRDFADTAALVSSLDLVISVDTAVAHLAGALGVPVWLLSRYDACWRWLAGREDTPWYPNMRIFRQVRAGDWAEVVERVRDALSNHPLG